MNNIKLLEKMKLIRMLEEEIANKYSENKMRCPTHLSIGQEAISAGVCLAINKNDFAVSTHRSHGHYIAKGGNINAMIAEIYGKSTGCSKGYGGSMHLIDKSVNFMGSTAIVGNSIPVGVGLGLSIKLKKDKKISTIFFGEAATEQGVFYESLNFAALKKLPVLFICENNLYSVYSSLDARQPKERSLKKLSSSIGVESITVDENNVQKIYQLVKKYSNKVRNSGKPFLIEFMTYRYREHCGPNNDDNLGYRNKNEIKKWKNKDPIQVFENFLLKNKKITKYQIQKIENIIHKKIKNAFKFAEISKFPPKQNAYKNIFAE
jgi:TPP-dependent pyruvate/acetoin dehydrogenase alpha subunit